MSSTNTQRWICFGMCSLFAVVNLIAGHSAQVWVAAMFVILSTMEKQQ